MKGSDSALNENSNGVCGFNISFAKLSRAFTQDLAFCFLDCTLPYLYKPSYDIYIFFAIDVDGLR